MTESRDAIVDFCREYLSVDKFEDHCTNGLQLAGSAQVEKIVTGVSLSQKLIAAAVQRGAQMILVHHGLFGDVFGRPPQIKGVLRERLRLLLAHDLNLCGFHLPLDAHPEIGNNASLCRLFNLKKLEALSVGFIGQLSRPVNFRIFLQQVKRKLTAKVYSIAAGPAKIQRVAVISGGSSPEFETAKDHGAEVFVCGDARENIVRAVEEAGLNFINAGHYNTERLGIRNLGRLLAKKFKLKVEFIEIPCPI